jgi:ketosteroid isomerase-like protein
MEIMNSSRSVDEAMAALEPRLHPEIEWVNPDDAIEPGTRRGLDGMRLVLENLYDGAGAASTAEVEEIEGRGDRVLIVARPHVRGETSGAELAGPPVGLIFTIPDGRVLRIEWHYDVDEARARFGQGG